jgi:hypothetical protein
MKYSAGQKSFQTQADEADRLSSGIFLGRRRMAREETMPLFKYLSAVVVVNLIPF